MNIPSTQYQYCLICVSNVKKKGLDSPNIYSCVHGFCSQLDEDIRDVRQSLPPGIIWGTEHTFTHDKMDGSYIYIDCTITRVIIHGISWTQLYDVTFET